MSRARGRAAAIACALAAAALAPARPSLAQAGAPARAPVDTLAIAYRRSIMNGLAAHLASLRVLGEADLGRGADVKKHTAALLGNALMLNGLFPAASNGEPSRALREIWARPVEFQRRTHELQEAVWQLDRDGPTGGRVLRDRMDAVVRSCAGCHTAFRIDAPPT